MMHARIERHGWGYGIGIFHLPGQLRTGNDHYSFYLSICDDRAAAFEKAIGFQLAVGKYADIELHVALKAFGELS